MSELKTAEYYVKECLPFLTSDEAKIEIFKIYGIQCCRAVLTECIRVANDTNNNDFEVANINLTQFIK